MKDNKLTIRFSGFGPFFTKAQENEFLKIKKGGKKRDDTINFYIENLENFIGKSFEEITEEEIKRYCEVTDKETNIIAIPSDEYENITNRIIEPIVLAKKYFTKGEYLPCIILSGLVAEMLTLIVWKMSSFSIHGKLLKKTDETVIFGKTFDQLGQERRIKLLKLIKAIKEDDKSNLEEVRNIRNKYVHSWDIAKRQDKGNAKKAVRAVMILFKAVSGMEGISVDKNGDQKLKINPRFLSFLKSES